MPDTVIEIKELSKSFVLRQEHDAEHRTVRELLAHRVKQLFTMGGGRTTVQKNGREVLWALKDISFDIEQGSRVGIIGRNGAGKSTLLKILSRITAPTSGQVHVGGRVVSLLEVGTGFHPELSGRENIFLNGVILGMKRTDIKKRFDQIVAFAGVERFIDMPVKKYSSGMHMRLAFSVAAHMEPEILIVDELLAVGDAQFQRKCMERMQEISNEDGRTIIFVSHSMEAVQLLCDTALFLEQGRLIAAGDIDKVSDQYLASIAEVSKEFTPNTHKDIYINAISLSEEELDFGGALVISCEIVSVKEKDNYALGIGIFNNSDARVASDIVMAKQPLCKGKNKLDIRVPLQTLVPGEYKCSFAIALDELTDIGDVVHAHPSFTIVPGDAHRHLFDKWHNSWGSNILNATQI